MKALLFAVLAAFALACASAPPAPDYSQCLLENVSDLSGNGVIDLPDLVECNRRLGACADAETGEEFLACSENYGV